jgi:hypothetical protein
MAIEINQGTASIMNDGAHSTFVAIWVGMTPESPSHWPRGLRPGSAAACLLGLWVRIPPGAWMSVVSVASVSVTG